MSTAQVDQLIAAYDVARFMEWQHMNNATAGTIQNYTEFDNEWRYPGEGQWGERYRVPLSVIVETARWTGARPWVCIPHRANDQLIWHIVNTISDGAGNLRPIFEFSNEIWNASFTQRQECADRWWNQNDPAWQRHMLYQAKRTREMAEIVGGRGDVVVGTQFTDVNITKFLLENTKLNEVVDAVAVGPYFGQFTSVDVNDERFLEQLLWDDIDGRVRDLLESQKALADSNNVQMWAYEAGQHLISRSPLQEELYQRINRSPAMARLHEHLRDVWDDVGGGLFCWFSLYSQYDNKMFGVNEITNDQLITHPKSFVF